MCFFTQHSTCVEHLYSRFFFLFEQSELLRVLQETSESVECGRSRVTCLMKWRRECIWILQYSRRIRRKVSVPTTNYSGKRRSKCGTAAILDSLVRCFVLIACALAASTHLPLQLGKQTLLLLLLLNFLCAYIPSFPPPPALSTSGVLWYMTPTASRRLLAGALHDDPGAWTSIGIVVLGSRRC